MFTADNMATNSYLNVLQFLSLHRLAAFNYNKNMAQFCFPRYFSTLVWLGGRECSEFKIFYPLQWKRRTSTVVPPSSYHLVKSLTYANKIRELCHLRERMVAVAPEMLNPIWQEAEYVLDCLWVYELCAH